MRKILLFGLFICSLSIFSQAPYGHEWIDITKPHYKVPIINSGIYRIPFSFLQSIIMY